MGNPAALVAGPGLSPMGIAATVSRAPSDGDDTLDLHWLSPRDGADGEEAVGEKDLRWVSTSRLPAVDDDALLLVDSLGDPWAFVWATGAILGDASGALAALDARLDALEATKTIHGIVDGSSGTPTLVEGTGFTLTDNGVGDYTINFTVPFSDVPSVGLTAGSTNSDVIAKIRDGVPVTASAARVLMRKAGVSTDTDFHFIAIGPA